MSEEKKSAVKQSFIRGSLTSSAGVFLSKLIGLFYIVPFRSIVGQANMTYYSVAYDYYTILLQVCSAGIPFAVAAMIAKYINKEDYRTAVLVRRLSTVILMVSGFVMALLFMLCSGFLSRQALTGNASAEDIRIMQNTFVILAFALFLVPLLYSYRGYYQGMKELKMYADSQVIEQFARVVFLLFFGWVLVYVFKMAPVFGIYAAVLGTSVGTVLAILYFMYFDRKKFKPVLRAAKIQTSKAVSGRDILREFITFSIPYLLVSIFGNSQRLINTNFFVSTMTSMGTNIQDAKIILSIIQLNCDKLTSIPQVLAIGFSAGVVPYMTVSLENRDWKGLNRSIEDCLDTVLYIALPVCFSMCVLAGPIYFIMYGAEELEYGTVCLQWSALLGLVTTVTPIISSMMLTLRFRRESIIYLIVGFVVKAVTFFPLMRLQGYTGAITSSVLCSLTIIFLSLSKIQNRYNVKYRRILVRMGKMILGCLCMNGAYAILKFVGINAMTGSRLTSLLELALLGVCGIAAYLFTTSLMRLPQAVFHKKLSTIIGRFIPGKHA